MQHGGQQQFPIFFSLIFVFLKNNFFRFFNCKKNQNFKFVVTMKRKLEEVPSDVPGGASVVSSDVEARLRTNDLIYALPKAMSVAVRRTEVESVAQQGIYGNDVTSTIFINTGEQYIYGPSSKLVFSLSHPHTAGDISIGRTGVESIIESIVLTSASGTELSRTENVGLLCAHRTKWTASQDWIDSAGGLSGWLADRYTEILKTQAIEGSFTLPVNNATTREYVVYLQNLSGFFAQRQLIPGHLISGMRIDIKWKVFSEAFISDNNVDGGTRYFINNLRARLDATVLSDGAQSALNKISASEGLVTSWIESHHSQITSSSTQVNHSIQKSVSIALNVFGVSRLSTLIQSRKSDSVMAAPDKVVKTQVHVGSLYFPQQPLQSRFERWAHANRSFGRDHSSVLHNAIRPEHWAAFAPNNTAEPGVGAYRQADCYALCAHALLERSSAIWLQGLPLNSARALEVAITFKDGELKGQAAVPGQAGDGLDSTIPAVDTMSDGDSTGRTISFFLQYLRTATVFLGRVVVRD